ncbi:hypothetical protein LTR37_013314 [Vermiconidia calcicola]|uniref:Uncharacterized protein n=1 Tax=Vermiconidia calcicola TaxID=1690605 RepID=A0ACC3MY47_9PEZI|nr:hypothetical protein LTR37_013314 [Vermiconidia calcicola]
MVFNTLTVGAAVTPSVIETYFSHYLNRASLRQKPTAHISYHEGLRLIRQFLDYSSSHTIEDLQSFTAQWVPAPHWVRINDAEVAPKFLERAAKLVHDQLGNRGLEQIGGKTWWQWRRPESPLRAEWIEMKKEYHERKRTGGKCERVILYVHGGAYYFGSVDEHRYQMQRHARKLKARVLAPRYRLAPQFPFPCGLFDCLATYYYLLEHFDPSQVLFAGDSAGGGMLLSILVTLRDQGQPLPAGTILLSPWVDLTHSFPSVSGDGVGDYIPPHGFHHKPSTAWPPPPTSGIQKPYGSHGKFSGAVELPATAGLDTKRREKGRKSDNGEDADDVDALPEYKKQEPITALPLPQFGHPLSMLLDGRTAQLNEQIQMYTTNELLAHPLVSPVMQPSLGGLPPMLIQIGGSELLKDEQIYLAHKAANPKAFPPDDTIMNEFDPSRKAIEQYPPTDVQLQIWDDLCHVPHTLSFTRPAKYMYRSVAQFGAWALAHAQHKGKDIQNDEAVSVISDGEDDEDDAKSVAESFRKGSNVITEMEESATTSSNMLKAAAVGKAGDPLPPFKNHMIRQRVTRHGNTYPLVPASELACLALDPASIGVPKPGPVRKWLAMRSTNDQRFANDKKKLQKKREKEIAAGYDDIPGENPPPTALVNRRRKGVAPEEKKRGKSWGLAMWSGWGSNHDEHTLQREQQTEKNTVEGVRQQNVGHGRNAETSTKNGNLAVPCKSTRKKRRNSSVSMLTAPMPWARDKNRPSTPCSQVNDRGQADSSPALSRGLSAFTGRPSTTSSIDRPASAVANSPIPVDQNATIPTTSTVLPDSEKVPGSNNTFLSPTSSRPHNGMQAFPFKLRDRQANASTTTLDSQPAGTLTPLSVAQSELMGDVPRPSELSSAARSDERIDKSAETSRLSTPDLTPTSDPVREFEAGDSSSEAAGDVVSPVEASGNQMDSAGVSPIETPKNPLPFKLRNAIFDSRTSMLGSIGADGMPNAHHDFPVRDRKQIDIPSRPASKEASCVADSKDEKSLDESGEAAKAKPFRLRNQAYDPRTAFTSAKGHENIPPTTAPRKPTEAVKTAPFKLRHTVYEPDVTLAKSTEAKEPAVPLVPQSDPAPHSTDQNPSPNTVSEAVRTSVSSSDKPPSYDSGSPASVTTPDPLITRPVAKQKQEYDDDRPPTPPPKDDKPYFRGTTGARKGNADAPTSKFSSPAPMIGNLSFEKKADGEKRPELESFVTASEGRELRGP